MKGNLLRIPTEVLMQRLVSGTWVGGSAAVTLLDWVDLGQQVVLVLERPVPSMDLFQYLLERGGSLPEHEAKVRGWMDGWMAQGPLTTRGPWVMRLKAQIRGPSFYTVQAKASPIWP